MADKGVQSSGASSNDLGNDTQAQTEKQERAPQQLKRLSSTVPPPIEEHFQPQYRHDLRPVPAYALEKLGRCYYNKDRPEDFKFDPFLSTIDGDWREFLHTVENKPAYVQSQIEYEKYHVDSGEESVSWNEIQLNLDGKWGGDDRLRRTFNSDTPNISPYDNYRTGKEKPEIWTQFWKNGSNAGHQEAQTRNMEKPAHRSKAGYWMSTEKRDDVKSIAKRILLNNPYVPLFFRILELVLSAIALGLAARIFVLSNRSYDNYTVGQESSTIMAICVQTVAIVYLLFIARDEFSGRPLGLRNPMAKLRLILLDLLFIIFSSANLSLTFNTLFDDRWVCVGDITSEHIIVGSICRRQRGLAAFLFAMLCMWVVTFTISILRVVEKVSTPIAPYNLHR